MYAKQEPSSNNSNTYKPHGAEFLGETYGRPSSQEISNLLQKPNLHHHVSKSTPLRPVTSVPKSTIRISKFFQILLPTPHSCPSCCRFFFSRQNFSPSVFITSNFVSMWKYCHPCNYQNLNLIYQSLLEILSQPIISASPNHPTHIQPLLRFLYSGLHIQNTVTINKELHLHVRVILRKTHMKNLQLSQQHTVLYIFKETIKPSGLLSENTTKLHTGSFPVQFARVTLTKRTRLTPSCNFLLLYVHQSLKTYWFGELICIETSGMIAKY